METVAQASNNKPLERLVIEAKADAEIMAALWDAVERFIKVQAARRISLTGTLGGAEIEDLVQAGYIALFEAVQIYDQDNENSSFLSLLSLRLRSVFADCQGIRSSRRDPLNYATSLDAPINEAQCDDSELTRADLIADQRAEDAFSEAENRLFVQDLHRALFRALDALPAASREIIKARYFECRTQKEIARSRGVSSESVRQVEKNGLRQMRRQASKFGIDRFVEMQTVYYTHCGLSYMRRTGQSPTEKTVFDRERLRNLLAETETRKKYTVI